MLKGSPGVPGSSGRRLTIAKVNKEPEREYLMPGRAAVDESDEDDLDGDPAEWDEYLDETQVYLRSKFYESWLWTDIKLPSQVDRDG